MGRSSAPRRSSPPATASRASSPRRRKPSTQISPLLYDLTSLQREANGRFGFSGAHDALARAGAVREAQGAHLSAHRLARAARGLPRHREGRRMKVLGETNAYGSFAAPGAEAEVGEAQQAHLRQHEDLGPLRHHPDAAAAEASERGGAEALRHGGAALSRRVLSGGRVPADHAHHACAASTFKTEGKVLQAPGWLAVYGRAEGEESENLAAIEQNEKVSVLEVDAQREPDQAAAALHGSDAALRDGRRRQARRGRRAARGDGATRASARRPRARRSSKA